MFVDELLAAYPNAKVILTIRETDAWLNSMDHSFLEILSWRSLRLLELLDWVMLIPILCSHESPGPFSSLQTNACLILSRTSLIYIGLSFE